MTPSPQIGAAHAPVRRAAQAHPRLLAARLRDDLDPVGDGLLGESQSYRLKAKVE